MENEDRTTRLARVHLFEGIIIGIYGNWLISLVDKISFTRVLVIFDYELWGYQAVVLFFSFACLVSLIALGIFKSRLLTRGLVFMFAIGHVVGNWASLYVEGFTLKHGFFLSIGAILFFLIYICELWRVREIERSRTRQGSL